MGLKESLQLIEDEMSALNERDWDRYERCFARSVVTLEPDEQDPIVGQKRLRDRVTKYVGAFPDLRLVKERLFGTADGKWVTLNSTFNGTHDGPFTLPDGTLVAPTGRKISVHGCSVFRIEDGSIHEFIGYYDQVEMFTQLGLTTRVAPA